MKTSKEFIIQKLNEMHFLFNDIKIRYEYRDYLNTHFIEVLPYDTFESNQDYILFEMSIEKEFEDLFGTDQEILFISSDSLNEIKESQFSLGYESIEKIESTPIFYRSFIAIGLGLEVCQDDTSYVLAA